MLSKLEYVDVNQLITLLNLQQITIHEALKATTQIDFRKELQKLAQFREAMCDETEAYLHACHGAPLNLQAMLHQLEETVTHSLTTCTLKLNLNNHFEDELTLADAYRYKYLVEYISFLKDFHSILFRHSEMLSNGNLIDLDTGRPVLVSAENKISPADVGVQGVPLNLVQATEPKPVRNFNNLLLEDSKKEKEKVQIAKDTKAVYRATVLKRFKERGGKKFYDSLTNLGQFMLLGELLGCDHRYVQGNINNENERRYTWRNHAPAADAFLDTLPKIK